MSLTYLVTTHNESDTLDLLLENIIKYKLKDQEIIILDDNSTNEKTFSIFEKYKNDITIHQHSLNLDYGAHKNYGKSLCKTDWVFQIDADEVANKYLLYNLDEILEKNKNSELIWVPRINYFTGLTDDVARAWRWRISTIPTVKDIDEFNTFSQEYQFLQIRNCIVKEEEIEKNKNRVEFMIPLVNYPDFQGRIYKNLDRIHYERVLHERIVGHKSETYIPPDQYVLSLMHKKTIATQLKTNKRYNELFKKEDNLGYLVRAK